MIGYWVNTAHLIKTLANLIAINIRWELSGVQNGTNSFVCDVNSRDGCHKFDGQQVRENSGSWRLWFHEWHYLKQWSPTLRDLIQGEKGKKNTLCCFIIYRFWRNFCFLVTPSVCESGFIWIHSLHSALFGPKVSESWVNSDINHFLNACRDTWLRHMFLMQ